MISNIKEKRTKLGLTQMKCAAHCGVNINSFIRWENNVAQPNEENEQKLRGLFGELDG